MIKNYTCTRLTKPSVIAKCIGKAVNARKPKARYLVGPFAPMMVCIKNLLGDRACDEFIRHMT